MRKSPLYINWSTFPRDFPVTFGLAVVNVVIFFAAKLGLIGPLVSFPDNLNIGTFGAHFFHHQLYHLASNLLILLLVGRLLEPQLKRWALPITVLIWLGTVGLLWLLNDVPVLGFSGIAMGLLTFAMILYRRNRQLYSILWPMVLVNVLFGLMPGVSWWGHLGGAIAGVAVFGIWKLLKR